MKFYEHSDKIESFTICFAALRGQKVIRQPGPPGLPAVGSTKRAKLNAPVDIPNGFAAARVLNGIRL